MTLNGIIEGLQTVFDYFGLKFMCINMHREEKP